MEYKGWNEFEAGSVLFPFEKEGVGMAQKHANDREYRPDSSYKASVAHWRVESIALTVIFVGCIVLILLF